MSAPIIAAYDPFHEDRAPVALGLGAVTTIVSTSAGHYAGSHAVLASSAPALTLGFQAAFYALIGVALAGAAIAVLCVEPKPKAALEQAA